MSVSQIHECMDRSESVPLYTPLHLYLKNISRVNITVQYPTLKQNLISGGKNVSSWDLIEKIKALAAPHTFIYLKVMKSALEFVRFEGDLQNRVEMKTIMTRLEGKSFKVTGFKEPLRIRVAEAKVPFPSKYDWDTFFRDAKHMNEMKAGERPDTIHIQNMPSKWFYTKISGHKPDFDWETFKRIWETFGEIRALDIPTLDPYRIRMKRETSGLNTFSYSDDSLLDVYIQFKDYMSFVNAMDALRGTYLLKQQGETFLVAQIKVDFDKSKHMSDELMALRRREREKLIREDKNKSRRRKMNISEKSSEDRSDSMFKEITPDTIHTESFGENIEAKIAIEEKKYMNARRKLESIRLFDFLFDHMKIKPIAKEIEVQESHAKKTKYPYADNSYDADIIERYKEIHEARFNQQKLKYRHALEQNPNYISFSQEPRNEPRQPRGGPMVYPESGYLNDWEFNRRTIGTLRPPFFPKTMGRGRGGRGRPYFKPRQYHDNFQAQAPVENAEQRSRYDDRAYEKYFKSLVLRTNQMEGE